MTRSFKYCIFVFSCISGFIAVPALANAGLEDRSPDSNSQILLGFEPLPDPDASEDLAEADALPARLDSWGDDSRDYGDYSLLTLSALPQGRLAQKPPFIDFDRLELGAFIGGVKFSSEFKANANAVGGFTGRVPVPGLPFGDWGAWADLYAGYINRKLPFFYPRKSGTWYGGTIGGDYTLTNGEYFVLRAQLGLAYDYWNGIQSIDNGFGGTAGMDFGFYWIKHNHKATVDLTPQITFSGSTYYVTFTLGFQVEF